MSSKVFNAFRGVICIIIGSQQSNTAPLAFPETASFNSKSVQHDLQLSIGVHGCGDQVWPSLLLATCPLFHKYLDFASRLKLPTSCKMHNAKKSVL